MAMDMPSTQILTSKYHSSLKGIQEILKEMVNSRLGSEKYKSAYESKNDLKKKKISTGMKVTCWSNLGYLNNRINNTES